MIARRRAGAPLSVLRVTMSDGSSVEFDLAAGESIEALDPVAARALQEQVIAGELQAVGARPARIDHDIDSKPRRPRPSGAAVGREGER